MGEFRVGAALAPDSDGVTRSFPRCPAKIEMETRGVWCSLGQEPRYADAMVRIPAGNAWLERELPFRCRSCSFEGRVWAKGRGLSTGLLSGRSLSDRALDSAVQSALMRVELKRCPRCGKRCYESWSAEFRKGALWLFLLFGPSVALMLWLSDARDFERELGDYLLILGSVVCIAELGFVGFMLWELRKAERNVQFSRVETTMPLGARISCRALGGGLPRRARNHVN